MENFFKSYAFFKTAAILLNSTVEERIQYTGVDMEYFEKVESEGKAYKMKSFTYEVNT